jgi:NADH-quinone oxidoreductase subunit E
VIDNAIPFFNMETTNTFPPFAITPEIEAEADERISHYPDDRKRSAVLPLLHIIQHQFGFINPEATEWVAQKLGLEPMQVYEVMERICELTGIDRSHSDSHHNPVAVSPCGTWSVEFAECLASCGTGPVCLVNDDFHEAVAPEKAEELLKQYGETANASDH